MIWQDASLPLLTRQGPWVFFLEGAEDFIERALEDFSGRGGKIFRLDATGLTSEEKVFQQFSSNLSFPGYFGRNWDAFVDCLSRVHGDWHGGKDMVFIFDNAEVLVQVDFLGILSSCISEAAENSNLQLDTDGDPTGVEAVAQNFIFLIEDGALASLVRGLRNVNLSFRLFDNFAFAYQSDGPVGGIPAFC